MHIWDAQRMKTQSLSTIRYRKFLCCKVDDVSICSQFNNQSLFVSQLAGTVSHVTPTVTVTTSNIRQFVGLIAKHT